MQSASIYEVLKSWWHSISLEESVQTNHRARLLELPVNFGKITDGLANAARPEFRKLKSDVPRTGRSPKGRTNIILDKDRELLIMEPLETSLSIEILPSRAVTQNRRGIVIEHSRHTNKP